MSSFKRLNLASSSQSPARGAAALPLFRRCGTACPSLSSAAGKEAGHGLAVTDARALAAECDATERLVHGDARTQAAVAVERGSAPRRKTLRLVDLHALRDDLCDLRSMADRESLSTHEGGLLQEMIHATMNALTHEVLKGDKESAAAVRLWLVELAVRPSGMARQLVFELFLQLSVNVTATLFANADSETAVDEVQAMETQLFATLRETLSKAVVVARTAASSPTRRAGRAGAGDDASDANWTKAALECLLLFTKNVDGGFRADRLRLVDPEVINFVVETLAKHYAPDSCLQELAVELLVAAIYTAAQTDVQDEAAIARSGYGVTIAAIERYCPLDLLLAVLYSTPSTWTRRVICMAIFDLVCEHVCKGKGGAVAVPEDAELVWRALLERDFPSWLARTPVAFTTAWATRTAKTLASTIPTLSEKLVLSILLQLQRIVQIDEYFQQNSGLAKVIQVVKSQAKSSATQTIVRKVEELLASRRVAEQFLGELWLAELLAIGIDLTAYRSESCILRTKADSVGANVSGEELEETFCFDDNAELRCAAQARLWKLAAATSSLSERRSFARVVALFIRRLPQYQALAGCLAIARELSTCLNVLVEHKESDREVLAMMVLLALDISQSSGVSYQDQRRLSFDKQSFGAARVANGVTHSANSKSTASRVLDGEVALELEALKTLGPDFFYLAAVVLSLESSPNEHETHPCQGCCCGTPRSIASDAGVCAAFALFKMCEANENTLEAIGGVDSVAVFLRACETRVAILAARLVRQLIKRSDPEAYTALLHEMCSACADRDDGVVLSNVLLHVTALRYDRSSSDPDPASSPL